MKKTIVVSSPVIALVQAFGVALTVALGVAIIFSGFMSFTPEPVGLLLLFSCFALLDLLIVLAYPLRQIAIGKSAEAFTILRWTLLWIVAGTFVWIAFLAPLIMPFLNFLD